ncbi:hypothetical protein Peur_051850 [Populus x canadensis]
MYELFRLCYDLVDEVYYLSSLSKTFLHDPQNHSFETRQNTCCKPKNFYGYRALLIQRKYITELLVMHLPKIEEIIASSYRSKDNKCTVQENINSKLFTISKFSIALKR